MREPWSMQRAQLSYVEIREEVPTVRQMDDRDWGRVDD